jgi:MFS family permease
VPVVRDALSETGSSARLVAANPNLRRVNLALLGSLVGDGAYSAALAVYAFRWGGAPAVGAYGAIRFGLTALTVPFLVTIAERLPRRRVLVGLDLLRVVLVVGVALLVLAGGPPVLVLVVSGVVGLVGGPFRPVQAALTPSLVSSPRELAAANGVSSTLESLAFFAGPALGGLLLAVADVGVIFFFNAATFVFSAVMLVGLRVPAQARAVAPPPGGTESPPMEDGRPQDEAHEEPGGGFLAEVLAGFRTVVQDRRLLLVVGLTCLQTLVGGASAVFTVVVALELVDLGDPGVGYLNAALGLGAVVGGLVALSRAARGTLAADFGLGVLLWTLPPLVVALLPHPVVAFAVFAVIGLANPLVDVNLMTLLQRLAPEAVLGRVFGALESSAIAAMALGAVVMPLLFAGLGPTWGLVALVLPVAAVTLACWPALRRLDRELRPPAHLDLVAAQPLFAGLPPAAQESLAERLVRRDVPAGTHVIEAGEAGDLFYLVESGRLTALRGGDALSAMGPGDCFGEIALLRDVPRTATVVADEPSTVLTLEREDFLSAVGADPETAARADLLVRTRLAR